MDEAKEPAGTVGKERLQLSQEEAFARIRLLRSPNVGPVSYHQLLGRFGSAVAALEALPDLAGKGGKRYTAAPVKRIDGETSAMRKLGARYLFHDSPDYPPLLAQVSGAPPILTCLGDLSLMHRPSVAMVGARNASAAAVRLARDFAYGLAQAGFTVVSGLARGIDGAAHQGALAAGGATVGVIASGIDIAYPPEHEALQAEVAEKGLLLAEQPCGTEPLARHFPARNRIIAGLCAGTLVVEAAPKSGSLITARLAGEMGREVMAIPGSPLDPRAHGCNGLIRDGAVLVQSVEDVRELITAFDGTSPRSTFREDVAEWDFTEDVVPADDSPAQIADLLTTAPVCVDELIRQTGASPSAVQLALLELELAGRLTRHAAGRVSLAG
ncbi:DNA-processing protein DprA [Novosphingobium mangrovi (ex Hu et al. 2023)]|uniref:DNA-processing protein DprA n=1 Tax=Novosphingobium mangrovi (ex Hu et al. 2023) TaxID=2930094 RepID=A0ABT0ABN4_9SPHN|nr:DNA-processing protein DprA [Novosphingobium mangrovi (ex Hu et al. 2023)]MCJ1960608.1 DNA-processing protein DprA [Novosphingobium mangrovi (ex Hu et al. 2023)]